MQSLGIPIATCCYLKISKHRKRIMASVYLITFHWYATWCIMVVFITFSRVIFIFFLMRTFGIWVDMSCHLYHCYRQKSKIKFRLFCLIRKRGHSKSDLVTYLLQRNSWSKRPLFQYLSIGGVGELVSVLFYIYINNFYIFPYMYKLGYDLFDWIFLWKLSLVSIKVNCCFAQAHIICSCQSNKRYAVLDS